MVSNSSLVADVSSVTQLLHNFDTVVVNPVIEVLFGVALVYFIWGVVQYVRSSDESAAREKGHAHILWGIVGMTIMISAFGILTAVLGTFSIPTDSLHQIIP